MNSIAIAVDGTGKVVLDGREEIIEARSYAAAQDQAIELLISQAQQQDTDITVGTNDPEAPTLIVSPEGSVQPITENTAETSPPPEAEPQPSAAAETETEAPAPELAIEPVTATAADPGACHRTGSRAGAYLRATGQPVHQRGVPRAGRREPSSASQPA